MFTITDDYCKKECDWVAVIPSNFEIMRVIFKYFGGFFIQESVFLPGIEKALEFEGMEVNETNLDKILIYINNHQSQKAEDRENG